MSPDERRSADGPGRRRKSETPNDPGHSGSLAAPDRSPPARYDGPLRRRDDLAGAREEAGGDEGGTGPLGGATYYGEGGESGHHGEATWGETERHRGRQRPTGRESDREAWSSRRADEKLRAEIREQLVQHPDVPASEVEVLVEGGEVTLQGTVGDRNLRWLVEDLVEAVSGVSLVHNRLRIARG